MAFDEDKFRKPEPDIGTGRLPDPREKEDWVRDAGDSTREKNLADWERGRGPEPGGSPCLWVGTSFTACGQKGILNSAPKKSNRVRLRGKNFKAS